MPYLIHDEADYLAMQWEVRTELGEMEFHQLLVMAFGTERDEESTASIVQRLQRDFPQAEVLGCMAAEAVMGGSVACDGIMVNFTAFEESEVQLIAYESPGMAPAEMGKDLVARLKEMPAVQAVELLLVDAVLDISDFLREASKAPKKIKFFGGISDDGSLGEHGRIFLKQGTISSGVVAIVFCGENLHVETFASFGWRPLGRKMAITSLESPYVIKEIDHRPASEVYEKYLGIKEGGNFLWDGLTFPLCCERRGQVLARHPRVARKDGALVFGADFREDETVRLAYGDTLGILEQAQAMRKGLWNFQPQGVFLISCVARWLLLQHDVEFELDACRGMAPAHGFYSYGEIIRPQGEIMLTNMTLVIVGLREGEKKKQPRKAPELEKRELTSHSSIMQHLVHFINVTAEEYEGLQAKAGALEVKKEKKVRTEKKK